MSDGVTTSLTPPERVFIVTEGEYSDYRIVAAFSSEAVADEFAKRTGGDVETLTVYASIPDRRRLYVMETGPGRDVHSWHKDLYPWESDGYVGRTATSDGKPSVHVWNGNLRVWGMDEARVTKAFQDRRASGRAEKEGIAR